MEHFWDERSYIFVEVILLLWEFFIYTLIVLSVFFKDIISFPIIIGMILLPPFELYADLKITSLKQENENTSDL